MQLLVVFGTLFVANGMLQEEPLVHEAVDKSSCSTLTSVDGTMYTVEVNIGTPEQSVDVVVDTGSNVLIAESCLCKQRGYCDPVGKCFKEEQSSTLTLAEGERGPAMAILNFGSGSILTEVASDRVRIGARETRMKKGVMLMEDQLLDFAGPFEGILGLGPPNAKDGPLALRIATHTSPFNIDAPATQQEFPPTVQMDADHQARPSPASGASSGSSPSLPSAMPDADPQNSSHFHESAASATVADAVDMGAGFLTQAGIERFSVCFGDDPVTNPGVLRLDPPPEPTALKSVGTMHWGIDFRGVSVGGSSERLGFCSKQDMAASQLTPCGAIPDSGTTYILGPKDQLVALVEGICDAWPRCSSNYTAMSEAASDAKSSVMRRYGADPWGIEPMSKSLVFEMLMSDCDAWLDEGAGIGELPDIHFHLADDSGAEQAVALDGPAYGIAIKERQRRIVYKNIPGEGTVPWGYEYTGRKVWICRAAFGVLDYPTAKNGPAWILGLPIFFGHSVGFDVSKEPPTVSFTPGPCGPCKGGAALITPEAPRPRRGQRPRKIHSRPRIPRLNVSRPL